MARPGIEIIYDGDCPFCASWARLVRLREKVGPVSLIDARSDDPRVVEVRRLGLDLDTGMVVRHGEEVYHGAAAMTEIARLSQPCGTMNRVVRCVFAQPGRAARVYPVLAFGRRIVLRLLGRRTIGQTAPHQRR